MGDDYIIPNDDRLNFLVVFFFLNNVGYCGSVVGFRGVVVSGGWFLLWKWFAGWFWVLSCCLLGRGLTMEGFLGGRSCDRYKV